MKPEDKKKTCTDCKKMVEDWNEKCKSCGFHLVMEPEEKARARYLRGPSLGALLWTQGWSFGARLYLWFVLSLIPITGIAALIILTIMGRRLSWKYGGWASWAEFQRRMRLMDIIGAIWITGLISVYLFVRWQSS